MTRVRIACIRHVASSIALISAVFQPISSANAAEPWTPIPGETPTSGHEIVKLAGDAYCKYLHGVADSDRAMQMWPTLFVSGGLVNPADVTGGSSAVATAPRLTAGLQYSFTGLYRGSVLDERAETECASYRRLQELLAFVARNKEGLDEASLRARAKVYEDALPGAQAKVDSARSRIRDGKVTLEDVATLESKLDAIRTAALNAKRDAAQIAVTSNSEDKPLRALVAAYADTEKHAEESEASLRKTYGWDVNVRGGYDQVFGVSTKLPVVAVATISVNLGLLFQGSGNDAAIEARPQSARWNIEGGGQPAVDAVRKLREIGVAEKSRLDLVTQTVTALETREKAARGIENERAQIFADYIFFDLVLARAEREFLRAHVAHIAALTEEHQGASR